jgi:hypothetical protein
MNVDSNYYNLTVAVGKLNCTAVDVVVAHKNDFVDYLLNNYYLNLVDLNYRVVVVVAVVNNSCYTHYYLYTSTKKTII